MRFKLIAVGIFSVLISNALWAEAPVEDINNDLSATNAPPYTEPQDQEFVQREDSAAQPAKPPAVLLSKIEALEQEIQELRGKLEVQAHDLKLLNEQQQAFYKDVDARLSKSAVTNSAPKIALFSKKTTPKDAAATPAPHVAEGVAKSHEESTELPTADNKGDGEQSYSAAYDLIKQKQYAEAISALEAFLIAYPGSSYQANANYWLGELYLMQGQTDQSIQSFSRVVKQYPKSNKAAGAQLKIGFAYYDKGQWKEAREALQKVTTLYPDTPSAHLATERLQQLSQQQ